MEQAQAIAMAHREQEKLAREQEEQERQKIAAAGAFQKQAQYQREMEFALAYQQAANRMMEQNAKYAMGVAAQMGQRRQQLSNMHSGQPQQQQRVSMSYAPRLAQQRTYQNQLFACEADRNAVHTWDRIQDNVNMMNPNCVYSNTRTWF